MSNTQIARTAPPQRGGIQKFQPADLASLVRANKSALQQVAAGGLSHQRLYRTMLMCVAKTPALQSCTAESVYRAMLDAAEVGLEPGGALGLAYLVPYKGECAYQIGYRGYIELAIRSGRINSVSAACVYEGDLFEYEGGLNPILRHVPGKGKRSGDAVTHVYALARFANGLAEFDVMTREEVEEIRKSSPSGNNGPWRTHYSEMAKKTVTKRLCKYLPRSIEVRQGLTVAADGRVHRAEPLRFSQDEEMPTILLPQAAQEAEPGAMDEEEFESAADVAGISDSQRTLAAMVE